MGFDEFGLTEYRTADGATTSVSRYSFINLGGEAWLARRRILSMIADRAVLGACTGLAMAALWLALAGAERGRQPSSRARGCGAPWSRSGIRRGGAAASSWRSFPARGRQGRGCGGVGGGDQVGSGAGQDDRPCGAAAVRRAGFGGIAGKSRARPAPGGRRRARRRQFGGASD